MADKKNTKQKTKPTKGVELSDMTVTELQNRVKQLRTEIRKKTLLIRAGRERNTRGGFNLRKDLARTMGALFDKTARFKAKNEIK